MMSNGRRVWRYSRLTFLLLGGLMPARQETAGGLVSATK
jgi:hypothetical protein